MKMFITFGFGHAHSVGGKTFDKDTVAVINGSSVEDCDKKAFEWFDGKFHQHVPEDQWDHDKMMPYFPKGYVEVNPR